MWFGVAESVEFIIRLSAITVFGVQGLEVPDSRPVHRKLLSIAILFVVSQDRPHFLFG